MAGSQLAPAEFSPQEQHVSAPSSADFYLEKGETFIHSDELPSVKDLATDFGILLEGYENPTYRTHIALEYANHLRARYEPGGYSSANPSYAGQQVLSRLYLDAFILKARRDVYQTTVKRRGIEPQTLPMLLNLIQGKIDFQKDIQDYIALNPELDSASLFSNLSIMMHHSRRVLYDDEVTFEKAKEQNISQLMAILAEHKVLTALHEEWPEAKLGTTEQDRMGTDIVVPTNLDQTRGVALQIKHSKSPFGILRILEEFKPPRINVPMHLEINDPLSLSKEHQTTIIDFVRGAPRQSLAIAA
jgi:hypothetical protein